MVPPPDQPIPIWLGTGGNPGSTIRAGQAGLPISYGILSGIPQRWGVKQLGPGPGRLDRGADTEVLDLASAN